MPNKYYYLVASLPYLQFNRPLPTSKDLFLSECRKWLSPKDLDIITKTNIKDFEIVTTDPEVMKNWKSFDIELRESLAGLRKERKASILEKKSTKGIYGEEDPLVLERKIEKKRWDYLDELELGNHFDMNIIIIYSLKLQILERLASFDMEKGRSRFESLCEVKI